MAGELASVPKSPVFHSFIPSPALASPIYYLGEDLRVVLLSVTEGEEKPLKYPPMFHSANVAAITRSDMAAATGFDRPVALANLARASHHARIFELSSKTGAGLTAWLDHLAAALEKKRQRPIS